jgi:hypothetical protein
LYETSIDRLDSFSSSQILRNNSFGSIEDLQGGSVGASTFIADDEEEMKGCGHLVYDGTVISEIFDLLDNASKK